MNAVTEISPVNLDSSPRKPMINSAMLFDLTNAVLTYWARWSKPEEADLATLWIASTWMTDEDERLAFKAHPRFFLIADKGSGKTRKMKLIRAMAKDPTPIVKAPVTAPGVRDALNSHHTVFLDEIDRQIVRGYGHQDLQALISAYEDDTGSLNGKGGYNPQDSFGPMVLAAKPRIVTATNGLIEDLFERSFIITSDKYADEDHPIPDLDDEFDSAVEHIPDVYRLWGEAVRPAKGKLWPIHSMPKRLTARMREISQPILAAADRGVDPRVIAAEGQDLRWAIRGRNAVQSILLGHGDNGNEILDDVTEKLRALGLEV